MIDISDITEEYKIHKIFSLKIINKVGRNYLKQPKADIIYLLILAPVVEYLR